MTIKALRFKADGLTPAPVRQDLSIGSAADLLKLKGDHPQAAFVVGISDLKLILEFAEAVSDRGEKSDSKELARLMLGEQKEKKEKKDEGNEQKGPKVPVIAAGFTTVGRVEQGVRALLKKASARKDDNIYVIGIPDDLFQDLVKRSAAAPGRARRRTRGRAAADLLTSANLEARLLADIEPLPIPAGLSAKYVGDAEIVHSVLQRIMRAAAANDPVLVLGESGTGKGIVARQVHDNGERRGHPFVSVNCSAIPTELFELEFFGCVADLTHRAPARIGHCEAAGPGTLFLDEVADLSLFHQAKLLQVLEEKKFYRIGSRVPAVFEARVVAATNRDLFEMKRSGAFREDLYYRLRGIKISTPSLRSHPDDIPLLASRFWESITAGKAPSLPAKVVAELRTYPWSNNVRGLKLFLNAAYSYFGRRPLEVRHVRLLWMLEEHTHSGTRSGRGAAQPSNPPWVDCMEHLRQVTEILLAVRETLKPLEGVQPLDGAGAQAMQAAALNRLNEIDALVRERKRFEVEAVRHVAGPLDDVKGALKLLCIHLDKDGPRAKAQKKTVEGKIKRALSAAKRGVEGLFGKV